MKTKVQIIQELLDKQAISAEDAVVLLMRDVQYVPYQSQPYYPYYPYSPIWQVFPEYIPQYGTTTNEPIFSSPHNGDSVSIFAVNSN